MASKNTKQGGFAHIVIVLVLTIGLAAIGVFTIYQIKHAQKVSKERALYAAADKEAQDYINAIAAKYPGKVEHNTSCSYSSAKYSKGSLGCSVYVTLDIVLDEAKKEEQIVKLSEATGSNLSWAKTYSTSGESTLSVNEIKTDLYKLSDKKCLQTLSYKDVGFGASSEQLVLENGNKILEVRAGCSGSALAEYY